MKTPENSFIKYTEGVTLEKSFRNDFSYKVSVPFPVDMQQQLLQNQVLPFECMFNVTSLENCQQAEQLIVQHRIKNTLKSLYII